MDPQQRMILEVTDRAFADAGVSIRCAASERTGAFVSTSSDDYLLQSADLCRRELFDAYTGTGTARAVAAGRLGHVFGLTGPIMHVDTACSSSLVALHLACRSLHDRECTLAVVAAANLIATPQNLLLRKALDAVAPRGRSRPFADDAEGFGQGKGRWHSCCSRCQPRWLPGDGHARSSGARRSTTTAAAPDLRCPAAVRSATSCARH
ncbi:hypothetical protein NIIDMKKI_29680 [Mycobacterium kansasii]|uniref:Ketosynthase family 3 (KS3) domain-containing protein n=1 Tax=Mycobacterium kansasii TaxID=1768 RepID=A0A7G1ID03_MYCKA|nr:hypothetical protein NIIDMKKI_29680 [Mycobacterium kansasii]